jgi:hypothetical protein
MWVNTGADVGGSRCRCGHSRPQTWGQSWRRCGQVHCFDTGKIRRDVGPVLVQMWASPGTYVVRPVFECGSVAQMWFIPAQMWASPCADAGAYSRRRCCSPFAESVGPSRSMWFSPSRAGKSVSVGSGAPALDKVVRNRDDREKRILHMTNWVCVPKAMQTNSAKHVQSRKSSGNPGLRGRQRAGEGTSLSIG